MLDIRPDETIILTARKHWFVFALEVLGIVLILSAVLAIITIGPSLLPTNITDSIGSEAIIALGLIIFSTISLAGTLVFAVTLTNFYLDVLLVTDKRIIDCEQIRLFTRDVTTVPIENVIDVRVEVKGIIATLFGFGTLYVQTAGEVEEVIVRGIKNPQLVRDTILGTYHSDTRGPNSPNLSPIP